jgi:hypothetical protein
MQILLKIHRTGIIIIDPENFADLSIIGILLEMHWKGNIIVLHSKSWKSGQPILSSKTSNLKNHSFYEGGFKKIK